MTIREKLEYIFTAGALKATRLMPEKAVYGGFRLFARAIYCFSRRRRTLTLKNLAIAFPDLKPEEQESIARRSFANVADSMALNALIMAGRISDERILNMVDAEDWPRVKSLIKNNSNGLLVISCHIGNWELMLQHAALRLEDPIHVIARKINNPLLEERIVGPMRAHFGIQVFYKKNAMMRLVKILRRKGVAGLMVDQRLSPRQGTTVDFFGRPAGTTATPALLQIRYNATVMPVFMIKSGPQRYRLIVRDPIEWEKTEAPMEEQIAALTKLHQESIETIIREYPDQWFWMHNRWGLKKDEL